MYMRHTIAMHLLQSGVDLSMIRSWLGYASIETTNLYIEIDFETKQKTFHASEKLLPKLPNRRTSLFHIDFDTASKIYLVILNKN